MELLINETPAIPKSAPAPRGAARCRRRSRANGRCRLPVQDPATGLCFKHAAQLPSATLSAPDRADLSADLFGEVIPSFKSAEEINATLAHVVVLVAQGRISSRRAAVMTYALSLILRGVLVIDKKAADAPSQFEWSDTSWRPACVIRAEAARNSFKSSDSGHASNPNFSTPTSNSSSNDNAKSPGTDRESPASSHASGDAAQPALSVPQRSQYNSSLHVEEDVRHGHR
jgi:hypothetical protein